MDYPSWRSLLRSGMLALCAGIAVFWPALPQARAEEMAADPAEWRVTDMAADGAGKVWGLLKPDEDGAPRSDANAYPRLAVFDSRSGGWIFCAADSVPENARGERLIPLGDGRMAVLWEVGDSLLLLTRSSAGGRSEKWCGLRRDTYLPMFYPLANGGLVLTRRSPEISYIAREASRPESFTLPDDLWRSPGGNAKTDALSYGNINAVECPDGTVWLWNYSLKEQKWDRCLKGIVRWRPGESAAFGTGSPFGEQAPVSAIAADGPEHMLAAVPERGLFRVRVTDFLAEPVPGPGPAGAFDFIEKISRVNGELYVVTCPKPDQWEDRRLAVARSFIFRTTHFYNTRERTGILWRWSGRDMAFVPLISGLDRIPPFGWVERPLIAVRGGLLAGAAQDGPWWLPDASRGSAFQLDSAQGLPLRAAGSLALTERGGLLGKGERGFWAAGSLPGRYPVGGGVRWKTVDTDSPAMRDSRGRLWAFGAAEADFAEWDGLRWQEHDLPAAVQVLNREDWSFCADGHDQGWLLPRDAGQTAVFDFTGRRGWEVFDSLEAAVEKRLVPGDEVPLSTFRLVLGPVAHASGAKGFFLGEPGTAFVLAGGKWHRSGWREIAGKDEALNGMPRFKPDGTFCLPGSSRTYTTADGVHWQAGDPEPVDGQFWNFNFSLQEPEGGWGVRGVESASADAHGVVWLIRKDGALWKWLRGKTVPVKNGDHPLLVPWGTGNSRILTDLRGNAFLSSANSNGSTTSLMVSPRQAPAAVPPPVVLSGKAGQAVVKTFAPPEALQCWRLDGRDWTRPEMVAGNLVNLSNLEPGDHHLEIMAYDQELTPLGGSQVLRFSLSALEDSALQALIHELQSRDLDRCESAAGQLRAQGKGALPLLRKLLEEPQEMEDPAAGAARESQRWWLRAVIQNLESRQQTGESPENQPGMRG